MVFDTKTGSIYVLGRLSDADAESLNNSAQGSQAGDNSAVKLGCEFYRYHTRGPEAGKWEFLSRDPQVPSSRLPSPYLTLYRRTMPRL
jgi:hypothetical protein